MEHYFLVLVDVAKTIGSISGLVSLVFIIRNQLKKRSRFKFDFHSFQGTVNNRGGSDFYDIEFIGHIKNQSNEQNSITAIYYAIWQNKRRTRVLANGMNAVVFDADDVTKKVALPILFEAKEGKHLKIRFEVCLTGTHVQQLVMEVVPAVAGSSFMLPKYQFVLAFKDVNEILFDDAGNIRSQKLIDLWWTLPNTFNSLKTGNPFPYLFRMLRIALVSIAFRFRVFLFAIGL